MGEPSVADDVIAWLREGGPWGGEKPEVVETHAALVFLTGERAFKLKKSVNLGYLNFSTLEVRRSTLERELVLNRRTAPSIYLQTLPVTQTGVQFVLGGEGTPVEWLLEMQRFASEALLSKLWARGLLTEQMIEKLARHVARFHEEVPVVNSCDWEAAVARVARENAQDLRSIQDVFDGEMLEAAIAARERLMLACGPVLKEQSQDVRHCHGDMHLGNVFLNGDEPTLFDCIEFDDFYAIIPPLYDLAFLLMDLLTCGEHRLANRALNAWLNARDTSHWLGTMSSLAALPLYLTLRAEIRAKTEARRAGGALKARNYLEQALSYASPGRALLVAVGGLSGTGKSTLAKAIAWRLKGPAGAVHLRTDEIRKRLAGVPIDKQLASSSYTPESSARVYASMLELARAAVEAGVPVVVDAVFSKESERGEFERIARELNVQFTGIWLEAPASVLEARLAGRKGDASDADVAVLHRQLAYEVGGIKWQRFDASVSPSDVERSVLTLLDL
ncbi:MAG: AAA family ATPase [Micropepsaceae bacterium]